MRRALVAAALTLPILGLAGGVVVRAAQLRETSEWRIPISGYDPRDPLRGNYIQFQYDWAVAGRPHLCAPGSICQLCLERDGAAVTARVVAADEAVACPARIDPVMSNMSLFYAPEPGGRELTAASRLFVSEASAPRLERQLRTGPMVVVARLTRDGRLINERLEPLSAKR